MALKIYKPINPGLRRTSVIKSKTLSKKRPLKSLITFRKNNAGRNNTGRITVRHRGGGARRYIRSIDFKREKYEIPAKVISLEYDPNRSAHIALICYEDGEKRYIVASRDMKEGQKILSSKKRGEIKPGNRFQLKHIPTGTAVYNIELVPGKGGQMCRSAGSAGILGSRDEGMAHIKLPSSEIRLVRDDCMATVGSPSNAEWRNIRWGKAGRMRHRGIRPTVRGKAMNPVDHPHGGGEGRHPIGMKHPKTYKGKIAMGVKTRGVHKYSENRIIQRRKSKRK